MNTRVSAIERASPNEPSTATRTAAPTGKPRQAIRPSPINTEPIKAARVTRNDSGTLSRVSSNRNCASCCLKSALLSA